MPATVIIQRYTGSGPTLTDITSNNTVASASDTHQGTASTSTDPIRIPASGTTNYSYWVVTRLNATVAPSGTIDNIRWYTDSSNDFGTGVTCKGQTGSTYIQATGTVGTTGTQLTTGNYTTLSGSPVDVFTHTSASPKTVPGSIVSTTGAFGSYFVYQVEVASTATAGTTGQETFTWLYDET